jgi:twinkle protein
MKLIPDTIDWRDYERESEDAAKVRPAGDFLSAMIADIGKPAAYERKSYLPWEKTHKLFWFRDGETTLWAGVNGHGKSAVTGMVAASLVAQSEKVAIASFEMKPRKTLNRMVRQFMGLNDNEGATDEEAGLLREVYGQFAGLCSDKLWIYDQQGTVTPERVVSVTRYCFKVLGVKHMVIDSLMKCVKGEDDYNGQKGLVDELTAIGRDYSAHVHLVHHLRKSGKETDQPDKNDVKGSGSIVDQVDNLMLVWRNKSKELDRMAGKLVALDDPDTVIFCRKQRNGTGWEGPIKLFFDTESMQYTGHPNSSIDMAAWPHRECMKQTHGGYQ